MTNCSCIKGDFNFKILASDFTDIIYQDLSEWMEGDHYLLPESYFVEVIPPGKKTGDKYEVFVNHSSRIKLPCVRDGIYTFRVESCGTIFERRVGIFPEMECCLLKAKVQGFDIDSLIEISYMIDELKIQIELGSTLSAKDTLEILNKKLRNIKCDCGCGN